MTRRRCIDCRGGIDDDASTHCEGCHSELLAEQIGRAEAAELERDQLRARCELLARALQGILDDLCPCGCDSKLPSVLAARAALEGEDK